MAINTTLGFYEVLSSLSPFKRSSILEDSAFINAQIGSKIDLIFADAFTPSGIPLS